MRLIKISTFKFEEFFEGEVPPYAILSHRWGRDELTYKEVAKNKINKAKQGYQKVASACEVAAPYRVDYLWCDTCCINKDSSAELSEAINSMFRWYQESKICLAYLADVDSSIKSDEQFRNSVWFTRAWTLQELLAPPVVEFYNRLWMLIGSRISACETIETVTGIPASLLEGNTPLSIYPTAIKMSWACRRIATRKEDIAYSLLGIFGVNMPPLYGEGTKAFIRLQEEMIRHTCDATFLYWEPEAAELRDGSIGRLLATSPDGFTRALGVNLPTSLGRMRLNLTNIDMDIKGLLHRWAPWTYALTLAATGRINSSLLLRRHIRMGTMYRIGVCSWILPKKGWPVFQDRKIAIVRELQERETKEPPSNFGFDIAFSRGIKGSCVGVKVSGLLEYRSEPHTIVPRDGGVQVDFGTQHEPAVASLHCITESGDEFFVDLTFDFDCNACAMFSRKKVMECVWETSVTTVPNQRALRMLSSTKATISTLGGEADGLSYFFRGDVNCGHQSKLPSNFIASDTEVWFESCSQMFMNTEYWNFRLWTR